MMNEEIATYRHPLDGHYAETIATLGDGREMLINCQYAVVYPLGPHPDNCSQLTEIGGRCNCGKLAGVDTAALVIEARESGKCGRAPRITRHEKFSSLVEGGTAEWRSPSGLTLTEEMDREDSDY